MFGLIIPILVGFAMATLGVALLFLGEVPFLGGKRIGAVRARIIGLVLLSFLPLAFGTQQAINGFFDNDTADGQIVLWSLCGGCWFVVVVLLFRVVVPKKQPRRASAPSNSATGKNHFGAADTEIQAEAPGLLWTAPDPAENQDVKKSSPGKLSSAKKRSKPTSDEGNPFDFE